MAKICMIAYTFYQSDPRVRREAEALASRGDSVDFICVEDPKRRSEEQLMGVRLYPLKVSRYQGGSTLRYLFIYLSFLIRSAALVTRLHFKRRYDVVHVHTMPDFLVFAALIPKLFGAKVILDVHDLMPELYICKFGKADGLIVRFITWIEKRSIAFAHRAIAVSIPHRNALVEHGNPLEKFSVIMNVPDPRIFSEGCTSQREPNGRFRLIYHGTVARRHGLEIALRAVALVRKEIPELEFLVIGHGDDMERIQKLAPELGLADRVRFQGRVPVDELPASIRGADLGVIPLIYDEFTRYMLPLKLLEYVHLGIPAIVTRTETIQTYFDDSMVRFVSSGSIEEVAAAIRELYHRTDKRTELAENATSFNRRYNWNAQKQELFNMVDSLLGEQPELKAEVLCQ